MVRVDHVSDITIALHCKEKGIPHSCYYTCYNVVFQGVKQALDTFLVISQQNQHYDRGVVS